MGTPISIGRNPGMLLVRQCRQIMPHRPSPEAMIYQNDSMFSIIHHEASMSRIGSWKSTMLG